MIRGAILIFVIASDFFTEYRIRRIKADVKD